MNKHIRLSFDENVYDMFDELITLTSLNGRIVDCNKAFLSFMNLPKDKVLNKKESKLLNLSFSKKEKKEQLSVLTQDKFLKVEESAFCEEDEHKFFMNKKKLIEANDESLILNIRENITEFKKSFLIYEDYKRILKMIAQGIDIIEVLNEIVRLVESKHPDMICSILLLDKSGKRLFNAAAPSLPQSFEILNGICISEDAISCAKSAYLKQRVIIEDMSTCSQWKVIEHKNIKSCWSQPIFSSKREVLGTFSIYYKNLKEFNSFDSYLIEDIASICGIAIEKYKIEFKMQKNLEKEKKNEQLLMHKSKQAMMGEMLENIAHQWRQPLSIISTSATGIQLKREMNICDPSFEYDALENISLNAQHLSQTIEDFRSYFKSDNKYVKFNIKEAYKHTMKLLSGRLKNENVVVLEDIEDLTLVTLENELTQVFMNIFNNSMDELENYAKQNRIISVKIYRHLNEVIIKIIDSARGASDEIIQRIFEPYFTTKHQNHGTGIGLYMCKEIIEKHMSGSIEARNNAFIHRDERFEGLEFLISIPIS